MCGKYNYDDFESGLPMVFSAPNKIQLLGLLANFYPRKVTPTELVRTSTFNYTSLYTYLDSLTDIGLVHALREDGRKAVYYTFHPEYETTDLLVDLHDACLDAGLLESENTFQPLFTAQNHAQIVAILAHLDQTSFTQPVVTDHGNVSSNCFDYTIPKLQATGLVERAGKDGKAYRYERRRPDLWEQLADIDTAIRAEFGPDAPTEQVSGETS